MSCMPERVHRYFACWIILISYLVERAQLIAAEMLSTEKSYVAGLQLCVTQFLIPLRNSNIVEPEKIGVMFSNIEQICEYNKLLLVSMHELKTSRLYM